MARAARKAARRRRGRRDRTTFALVVILIVGALLRVAYLNEARQQPDFDHPVVDAAFHDYWARGLAFGQWQPPNREPDPEVRSSPYVRPPGYPHFLSLVYRVTGGGYVWPRIVQMALGLVNVVLAFWLGKRVLGPMPGLITAALMSTYWALIYFEGELQATTLAISLLLLLALALGNWVPEVTWRRTLLAGVLIGLGALVRPNFLIYLPIAMVWSLWQLGAHAPWRRFGMVTGGLVIGTCAMVLPSAVRNYVVSGELVPITTLGGINLYLGNNPDADGLPPPAIAGLGEYSTCFDFPALRRSMGAEVGREVGHREFSSILADRAFDYMRENPGRTVWLTWRKALLFWGPAEVSNNKAVQLERANSLALRALPWNFPLLFSLALLGGISLVLAARRKDRPDPGTVDVTAANQRAQIWLLVLMILGWFLSVLPFIAAARYRVPLLPLLMVLASWGVHTVWVAVRARRWTAVASWTAVAVGLILVTSINAAGYELNRARWHYVRGFTHAIDQEWAPAIDELSTAIRLRPDYTQAYIDLGAALHATGRSVEAIRSLQLALDLEPDSAITHFNLAVVLASGGQLLESREHLRRTLLLDPGFHKAQQALEYVERLLAEEPE